MPELDFEDHETWRRHHARLAERRLASPRATVRAQGETHATLASQTAAKPRVRSRSFGPVARIRRADGKRMLLEAGVVELANQPGFKFDFRIAMRLVDNDGEIRLEPHAVSVIAREGGPPPTSGNIRTAAVGAAIVEAGRRLSHEEPDLERRGRPGTVQAIMRTSREPTRRASRAQVHQQTRDAVRAYKEAKRRGRPTTKAVADALGVNEEVARQRVNRARKLGLLPPAESTRPK